jgi:DDE family transposase
MEPRVDEREWVQYQWPYLLALLGGEAKVDELAYRTGAFVRKREVHSPADLLQMLMIWAVAERSLRETVALASEAGLAELSDVALLKRLKRAGPWLGGLLGEMLTQRRAMLPEGVRIRVIDATAIARVGHRGTDLRVHLAMDLGLNCVDSIDITDGRGSESLDRFTFLPGEIVITDRGYAHRKPLARLSEAGANFIVRLPWASVPLEESEGQPFDLFAALRSLPEATSGSFSVQFQASKTSRVACRVVAIRKSEAEAARSRKRALAESRRHGTTTDPRTLEAAGYFFVLTNLLDAHYSADEVLELYRLRWQIEMKFKNLKSVLHLGQVPARSGELFKVYVMAKLLVALVIENLLFDESFSPWGYPIAHTELLAAHSSPA